MKVIQRSPDLGLKVRLQRLPGAPAPVAVPEPVLPPPPPEPLPPWWWGHYDDDGNKQTEIEALWATGMGWPESMPTYTGGGDTWLGIVENVTKLDWAVEFTPKIWDESVTVIWQGDPINLDLPPVPPVMPEQLTATLPETLEMDGEVMTSDSYWYGKANTPGQPDIPIPTVVAAGNILAVNAETRSMSGTLVATAVVNKCRVGEIKLDLMRQIHVQYS